MKKTLRWIGINGLYAGLLAVAIRYDSVGATRLVVAWTWIGAILSCVFHCKEVYEPTVKNVNYPSVNRRVSFVYDVAICAVLVWFGWWLTFGAFWLAQINDSWLRRKVRDLRKELHESV